MYFHFKCGMQVLRSPSIEEFLGVTERIKSIRLLLGPNMNLLSSSQSTPVPTPSNFTGGGGGGQGGQGGRGGQGGQSRGHSISPPNAHAPRGDDTAITVCYTVTMFK